MNDPTCSGYTKLQNYNIVSALILNIRVLYLPIVTLFLLQNAWRKGSPRFQVTTAWLKKIRTSITTMGAGKDVTNTAPF